MCSWETVAIRKRCCGPSNGGWQREDLLYSLARVFGHGLPYFKEEGASIPLRPGIPGRPGSRVSVVAMQDGQLLMLSEWILDRSPGEENGRSVEEGSDEFFEQ